MENITGDFRVFIDQFPEFEDLPEKGETNYKDSMVKEFEISDGFFDYVLKARIEVWYKRYFREANATSPEEDDITDYEIAVETITGTRTFKENYGTMKLTKIELEQFEKILMEKIEIIL